jgi:O-antigen/teichoic acid export membrane protein
MDLKFRFLSGIVSGVGGVALKAAFNILLIPIIISQLGAENYGFYTVLISLSEILVMLDLGLTTGVIHRLSRFIAMENQEKINETLGVGQRLYGLFLLWVTLLGVPIIVWFKPWLHLPVALGDIADVCLYIVLADAALNLFGCFFRSVLMAHSLYQWTNTADIIQGLSSNLLSCAMLLSGQGLIAVLAVRFLASLLQNGFLAYQVFQVEPNALRPQLGFSWEAFKDMFVVSVTSMISKFCSLLTNRLDGFIITANLGLTEVAVYAFVLRIFGQVPYFISKLSEGILPMFLKIETSAGVERSSFFFLRISALINFITLLLLIMLWEAYPTIHHFLAKGEISYQASIPLALLMVPLLWTSGLVAPAYDYLFAKRHFRFQTVMSVTAAVINFSLSFFLIKTIGITGSIIGGLIPHLIEHQVFLIPRACRELNVSWLQYVNTVHFKNIPPLAAAFLLLESGRSLLAISPQQVVPLLVLIALAGSVSLAVWLAYTASPLERELLTSRILPAIKAKFVRVSAPVRPSIGEIR